MKGKLSELIRASREADISLRLRIAGFFAVSVIALISGILAVLAFTGSFSMASREILRELTTAHSRYVQNAEKIFGDMAVETVRLSRQLSGDIEEFFERADVPFSSLTGNPDLILILEEKELPVLSTRLDVSSANGIFMALEATVNPELPDAADSKAGLFLRSAEPEMADIPENKLFLRGIPLLAIKSGVTLQARWDLEFHTGGREFYNGPVAEVRDNPDLPLSRQYFWTFEDALDVGERSALLCSIPIPDSYGGILGVCGFEVSEMHFRSLFDPPPDALPGTIHLFSLYDNGGIFTEKALISGTLAPSGAELREATFTYQGMLSGLEIYGGQGVETLLGLHDTISLYAKGSPFEAQKFSVMTAIPKQAFDAIVNRQRLMLTAMFVIFLAIGILFAVYISKRIVRPITEQTAKLGGEILPREIRTNIPEVDLLIKRLLDSHEAGQELRGETEIIRNILDDFIAAARTLTPTEMVLFQYYAEGRNSEDIKKAMFISEGTLRVHSTHLYQKLKVANKNELLVYLDLIKKSGKYAEIFPDH
ncbi:MAG: LuxR family transcriptional regulator [Fusobacteriaceae bacterium]|jgi:DNA-binding CsgD family transcriptional regulator|nr:LuxR family transcriptional regulator [Fusobacteriaceae bacterium]